VSPGRTFTDTRAHLTACKCVRIKYDSTHLLHHEELHRHWPDVNEDQHEDVRELLDVYTDLKNTKPQAWVRDPVCDGEVYPGIWRLVENGFDKQRTNIRGVWQVLRKGFATTLNWEEALLQKGDNVPGDSEAENDGIPERYLNVIFRNMNPETVDALVTAMITAETVVNPVIQKQPYTGTWYYVHVRPEQQEDGSAAIIVLLARPRAFLKTFEALNTPRETDVYYCWNVPRAIAQSVVDGYRTGTGSSGTANYATAQGTVDLIFRQKATASLTIIDFKVEDGCLMRRYHDYHYRLTESDVNAFDIGEAPQGWIYRVPTVVSSGDYYSIRVEKLEAITRTIASHVVEDMDDHQRTLTKYLNATSIPSIPTPAQGEMVRRSVDLNRFCEYEAQVSVQTSVAGEIEFDVQLNDDYTQHHIVKWNQRTIDIDAPSAGDEQYVRSFRRNLDGTYNWWVVTKEQDNGIGYGAGNAIVWYENIDTAWRYTWTDGGTVQHLWVTYHSLRHDVQQFRTEAEAYDYISSTTVQYFRGTGVRQRGEHRYRGERVTDNGWSAWSEVGT
jgi:hypothetical protein